MFDRAADEVTRRAPRASDEAEDREIIGFGGAAGEEDFVGRGIEQRGGLLAGVFQSLACVSAGVMTGGGIAGSVAEVRPHRFPHGGKHGRRGVVIKVNAIHPPTRSRSQTAGDGTAPQWSKSCRPLPSFYSVFGSPGFLTSQKYTATTARKPIKPIR